MTTATEKTGLLTPGPQLSGRVIGAYATCELPSSARDMFVGLYLRKFYIDNLGVPPGRLAVVDAGVHAAHYFTAIFSGVMIDSTNNAFGRRRTHILIWCFVVAIVFSLLFIPPDGTLRSAEEARSSWSWPKMLAYYGPLKVVFDLAPLYLAWLALGPELTQQVEERNRLYAATQAVFFIGRLTGATLPAILIAALGHHEQREVFAFTALIISTLLVLTHCTLVFTVSEPRNVGPPCSFQDAMPTLRNAFRNRCFVGLLLIDLCNAIAHAFASGILVFYVEYYLQVDVNEVESWVAMQAVLTCTIALCSTPVWAWAADRFGRYRMWMLGWALAAPVGFIQHAVITPGSPHAAHLWMATSAWFAATGYGTTFLWNILKTDVLDYAQLRTGRRQEAQYLQFWQLTGRFIGIFGNAIPFALLGRVGYQPNDDGSVEQTPEVGQLIGFLCNVVQSVVAVVGLAAAFAFYPMREKHYARVVHGLALHAQGLPAEDPFTGRAIAPPPPPPPPPEAAAQPPSPPTAKAAKAAAKTAPSSAKAAAGAGAKAAAGEAAAPVDDASAAATIDAFSLWELRWLLRMGLPYAVWHVRALTLFWLLCGCAGGALASTLLVDDSVSEVDACLLFIAVSLFFTFFLLELLRARPARLIVGVGPERIRAHMETVFF